MNKKDFDNALRQEVYDLLDMAAALAEQDDGDLRMALSTPELFASRKAILTGCGDSYCAALAARPVFEKLGHIGTSALSAIEAARHLDSGVLGGEPHNPLLYCISVSGTVSRMIEIAKRGNETGVGAHTVAVTGNPDSPLAQECQTTMAVPMPPYTNNFDEHSPGLRSYYASIYALMTSAIRMGEVKMHYPMSQAGQYRKDIVDYIESYKDCIDAMDEQMFALAEEWKDIDSFEFVAAGNDMVTAWFDSAKIYEATGDVCTYENVEDWCHINFFARDYKGIATVLIAEKNNPAMPRIIEAAGVMARIGRPCIVFTDADESLFPAGMKVCKLPSAAHSWITPAGNYIPFALFAGYLAKFKNVGMFRQGMEAFAVQDGNKIKTSKIEIV